MGDRKIVSHSVKPFTRYGIKLSEAVWIDDIPYFTSRAIAEWLELKAGQHNVRRIVDRNPYILEHTKVIDVIIESDYPAGIDENDQKDKGVNLTPLYLNGENKKDKVLNLTPLSLNGENKKDKVLNLRTLSPENQPKNSDIIKRTRVTKMRLFSPVGLQLVAMESNTKKAQEYKVLVATLVWKLMQGIIKEVSPEQAEIEKILMTWPTTKYRKRGKQREKYMELTECSRTTAYRHYKMFKNGENPTDKKWRNNTNYIKKYGYETKIRKLFFQNPSRYTKDIWRDLGSPKTPSYSTFKRFVKKLKMELLTR